MRTLYILRHGEAAAEKGGNDMDRALTDGGLAAMQALAHLTDDHAEGAAAALEKRAPGFEGR